MRLIPPLHLHGRSTSLSSLHTIPRLNGKMGRNNFPEGNFRFMTSYPLLGRITSPTVLHFVDRTRLTARSGPRRGIGNNLCGTIYVFSFRSAVGSFPAEEAQQQPSKESQIKVSTTTNGLQGRAAKILLHLAFLAVRQHCGHFTT